MDVKDDTEKKKPFRYIMWGIIGILFLWFNYDYLYGHLSSNSLLIMDYTPQYDELEKYQPPAVAASFFVDGQIDNNQDFGYYFGSGYKRLIKLPKILIVPEEDAQYVNEATAKAYWELLRYRDKIKNVFLLMPSCSENFKGVGLYEGEQLDTILGNVKINTDIISALHGEYKLPFQNKAFEQDSYWKVQVPFLQRMLADFRVIPIVYGATDAETLSKVLGKYVDDDSSLLVFVADLSGYYNRQGETEKVQEKDVSQVENKKRGCSYAGIEAVLNMAKQRRMASVLIDAMAKDNAGEDIKKLLGYEVWMKGSEEAEEEDVLTPLEQQVQNIKLFANHYGQELMKIAYQSLERWVVSQKEYKPARKHYGEHLFDKGNAFVTLYDGDEMRGQYGSLRPKQAIALDVAENVRRATKDDIRFGEVKPEELKNISISIAFLTDYERLEFANEAELLEKIVQGTDGVVLRDGNRQGLFLPSQWQDVKTKEEFLQQLKLNAGMSPTYWSPKLKAYRFRTVEIKKDEN